MTDAPSPEERPDSDAPATPPEPQKSKVDMTSDMSGLKGAQVDHSNPLVKISGLSLDPDAPPPPPKPDPPPAPEPDPEPEPIPTAPPVQEPASAAKPTPTAPPVQDPDAPGAPKSVGDNEEPTLGDLRDEIAAEIARTRTNIQLDEDDLAREEKPKARWGLRILVLLVVISFLAVVGAAGGFYLRIRNLERKAKAMDVFETVGENDVDAIQFIIDWDPGQLAKKQELKDDTGGKSKVREFTPLTYACAKGHAKVGWRLIKKGGMKPTVKDKLDNAAIHYATRNGRVSCLKMLKSAGVSLESRGQGQRTPMHMAVDYQQRKVLAWLVKEGADINGRDYAKATPLHHAAELGFMEVAIDLIEAKALIEAKDESGQSPLHYASSASMVELLLEADAKSEVKDGNGLTPLHLAARDGRLDAVKALLNGGADINATSDDRETPLDVAHKKVKYFLRTKGARSGRD